MEKKFFTLSEEYKTLATITQDQLDALRLAFSELTAEEQASALSDVAEAEKKVEDQDGDDEGDDKVTPPAEGEGEGEGSEWDDTGDGDDDGEETPEAKQFSEGVKTAFGMTAVEIKAMQKQFSEMSKAVKAREIEDKLTPLVFSEATPKGRIAPKAKDKVLAFASKLSDQLVKEFFEVLASENFVSIAMGEAGKAGSDSPALQFAEIVKTAPKGVDPRSYALSVIAKQMSEKENISLAEATVKADKYLRDNKLAE